MLPGAGGLGPAGGMAMGVRRRWVWSSLRRRSPMNTAVGLLYKPRVYLSTTALRHSSYVYPVQLASRVPRYPHRISTLKKSKKSYNCRCTQHQYFSIFNDFHRSIHPCTDAKGRLVVRRRTAPSSRRLTPILVHNTGTGVPDACVFFYAAVIFFYAEIKPTPRRSFWGQL